MNIPPAPTTTSSGATEDDYSYYYSFFQDAFASVAGASPLPDMPRKKRRRDGEDTKPDLGDGSGYGKRRSITRILTSLATLEEEEDSDRRAADEAAAEELNLLQSNHERKAEAVAVFHSRVDDYFNDAEEADTLRSRRARATTAVMAVAAAATTEAGPAAPPQQAGHHQRRLWVKDRSRAWWDRCNHPDFPDSEFKKAFRMSRATFDMICEELGSAVAKEDTMLRAAIPVRQRVAVCIWRLATGEPLRLVSKRFGLGISTCHKLVLEVCSAIKTVLMGKFVQWPNDSAADAIKSRFEAFSGIPKVVGSMYTTHVPIIAPKVSVAAYFNRRHTERNQKTSYSITVQGVVDPNGVFTDVCIGWPGSMPDDKVLEKSLLFRRASAGMLKDTWIVGNSGYPLMDWVLVPYTHRNLTWTQHAYNEKIGEIQRVAKDAFARLKGRWSCLQKRTEVKLQDLPVVLGACCVLHNICELRHEEMEPELNYVLMDDEMVPENSLRSVKAMQARDTIAHNLLHRGFAGTNFF